MRRSSIAVVVLAVILAACAGTAQNDNLTSTLENQGGSMEGHTPRGFQGMGTGLFAGDNLNSGFPNNDGVQIFLTFDLSAVPEGNVVSAVLRSEHAHVLGSPFKDLGVLRVEEVRYDSFSAALWDLEPTGDSCVFASTADGPFECDLAETVQQALDDGRASVQFRLRFDKAADGDGQQDLVMFYVVDSNTNEPGIFVLEVELAPAESG